MIAVEAKAIHFRYPEQITPVLDGLDFQLKSGQTAAITGASGCGKSTLGYCLCGVIPRLFKGEFPGEVRMQGRVGIVFQDPDSQIFLPTVEDELAFGPENLCLSRLEIGDRVQRTLDLMGIKNLRQENPATLSGGQKQLVVLGAVLTLEPDILVLDEPLAQLDGAATDRVKSILLALKKQGKTLIIIEHDQRNLHLADEIWRLERGQLFQVSGRGGNQE